MAEKLGDMEGFGKDWVSVRISPVPTPFGCENLFEALPLPLKRMGIKTIDDMVKVGFHSYEYRKPVIPV